MKEKKSKVLSSCPPFIYIFLFFPLFSPDESRASNKTSLPFFTRSWIISIPFRPKLKIVNNKKRQEGRPAILLHMYTRFKKKVSQEKNKTDECN
jgi:hypothetical protein